MTTDDRFGPTLARWLNEEAEHRVPSHLAEVLVHTAATRQRPWWSSLERLLPMTTTTLGGRVAAPRPVLLIVALVLLLTEIVGIGLFAGRTAETVPSGPPSNGRLFAMDGTSLVSFAANGGDRRVLLDLPATDVKALAISPDGNRVAYPYNSPYGIQIAHLDDGSTTTIPVADARAIGEESIGWSPDGRALAFAVLTGMGEDLAVAAADGSSVRLLGDDIGDRATSIIQPSFSPDGEWIAFAGNRTGAVRLFVIRPDGTGLRELETRPLEVGDAGGPVWSPDRDDHLLAYETFQGNALHMRVFALDAGTDHEVSEGFWPAWSPDGTKLAGCCASIWSTDDILKGTAAVTTVFGQPDGYCGDNLDWSGRAICSVVVFSPDGQWVVAGDIAGKDLLLARSDGTGPIRTIKATTGISLNGSRVPIAWQPVWP
jgi:WD40 repeat protein